MKFGAIFLHNILSIFLIKYLYFTCYLLYSNCGNASEVKSDQHLVNFTLGYLRDSWMGGSSVAKLTNSIIAPTTKPSKAATAVPTGVYNSASRFTSTLLPSSISSAISDYSPTSIPSSPTTFPSAIVIYTLLPTSNPSSITPTSNSPTMNPSHSPTLNPTNFIPSANPSISPTPVSTNIPSSSKVPSTKKPKHGPSVKPSISPTINPILPPTKCPSCLPSTSWPTESPSIFSSTTASSAVPSTEIPTFPSTEIPTFPSTVSHTTSTNSPSNFPTVMSSSFPSFSPSTELPTETPSIILTQNPTTVLPTVHSTSPTLKSTKKPSLKPTTGSPASSSTEPTTMPSQIPTLTPYANIPSLKLTSSPSFRKIPTTKPTRFNTRPTFASSKSPISIHTASSTFSPTHPTVLSSFSHPGALDSKAELDFIKSQIQAQQQPWYQEFASIQTSASATATPHGAVYVQSTDKIQASNQRNDAYAAYTQALLWYFTDDETYAKSAIAILNSWAALEAFTSGSDQDKLQAGWTGAVFAPAAEILRLYSGWSAASIANLQAMFKRAYYPQLNTMSTWNGNVDLTQIDAIMAIAVFNEDATEFSLGLSRLSQRIPAYFYLTTDGPVPEGIAGDGGNVPSFWFNPTKYVNGLAQETCRDNGHHVQFALGSALHAMETAWHQGIDVYSLYEARMTAALELQAQLFDLGSMEGICSNNTPSPDRYDTWEVGYNHFHNRKGISLPYTLDLILNSIRPYADRSHDGWNLVYETLTHADLPSST